MLINAGLPSSALFTSTTVPFDRRVNVTGRLYGFNDRDLSAGLRLRADFRQLDIDDVGQLGLRMIGDADARILAFAADPFVRLRVKKIVGNIHDFL